MTDLIARLSAATEGSRELSDEVLRACGWTHLVRRPTFWIKPGMRPLDAPQLDPTVSLDDALRLVPEGWDWSLYSDGSSELYYDEPYDAIPGATERTTVEGVGNTSALGVCVAILKARAKEAQRT